MLYQICFIAYIIYMLQLNEFIITLVYYKNASYPLTGKFSIKKAAPYLGEQLTIYVFNQRAYLVASINAWVS